MREIKFRAIKQGERKFVYGYFVREGGFDYIVPVSGFNNKIRVIWNTAKQFTGLLDKNGKEIYEGDILYEFKEKTAPIANNGINRKFVVDDIRELEFSPLNCEVIGNTFENLELLN